MFGVLTQRRTLISRSECDEFGSCTTVLLTALAKHTVQILAEECVFSALEPLEKEARVKVVVCFPRECGVASYFSNCNAVEILFTVFKVS